MKFQIKDIAVQAGMTQMNCRSDGKYVVGEEVFVLFAELIVQECLNIARQEHKNALEFDWDNDDTAQTIRDSISEHFGIRQ